MRSERPDHELVERADRQHPGDAVQQGGVDGQVGAGQEQQREQHELHYGLRRLGVADHRGHRHAERAEAAAADHQRGQHGGPVRRQRRPVHPADADDQRHVDRADHHAVREQAEEVGPGRQRRRADPLEYAVLAPHGQGHRQLAVTGAQHRQRRDHRHVVPQGGQPVEVRAAGAAAEQGSEDRDEQDREREREDSALRVPPERQLLVLDLVGQQREVMPPAPPWMGQGRAHLLLLLLAFVPAFGGAACRSPPVSRR